MDGQLLAGLDGPCGPHGDPGVALGHVVAAVAQAAMVQKGEDRAECVALGLALHLEERERVGPADG